MWESVTTHFRSFLKEYVTLIFAVTLLCGTKKMKEMHQYTTFKHLQKAIKTKKEASTSTHLVKEYLSILLYTQTLLRMLKAAAAAAVQVKATHDTKTHISTHFIKPESNHALDCDCTGVKQDLMLSKLCSQRGLSTNIQCNFTLHWTSAQNKMEQK